MKKETTGQELKFHGISRITEGSVLLLGTVTLRDNSQDIWLECIDDNGDKVRLIPGMTGWQDGRKEVFVMNCGSGENRKLFFQKLPGGAIVPHDATLTDERAEQVMWTVPFPCLEWAINRAK
jgi:hypothetical protein